MNEATNRSVENFLKQNRYLRYDEIDKIMGTVNKLTEWKEDNEQGNNQGHEPPLRAMFMKEFNIPVWLMTAISIIMFIIGRYS